MITFVTLILSPGDAHLRGFITYKGFCWVFVFVFFLALLIQNICSLNRSVL